MKTKLIVLALSAFMVGQSFGAEVCSGELILQKKELVSSAKNLVDLASKMKQADLSEKLSRLGAQLEAFTFVNNLGVCLENGKNTDYGSLVQNLGRLLSLQDVILFREEAHLIDLNPKVVGNFRLPSGINSEIEL